MLKGETERKNSRVPGRKTHFVCKGEPGGVNPPAPAFKQLFEEKKMREEKEPRQKRKASVQSE